MKIIVELYTIPSIKVIADDMSKNVHLLGKQRIHSSVSRLRCISKIYEPDEGNPFLPNLSSTIPIAAK
jgi:hypothetical protein